MSSSSAEVLEKIGPWEWKKDEWVMKVRFEPSVHMILEGPPRVIPRPIMFSEAEIAMISTTPETLVRWSKIPKYLHQDLAAITRRARIVAHTMEVTEAVGSDPIIRFLFSRG